MNINVGKRVHYFRKKQGYTLKKLSQLSGIHYVTLSSYEKGKKVPKLRTLKSIAEALRVPISDLIEEKEDEYI